MMFCKHSAERDACIPAMHRACFKSGCGTSLCEMLFTEGYAELTETMHHAAGTMAAAMTTTAATMTTTAAAITTTVTADRH